MDTQIVESNSRPVIDFLQLALEVNTRVMFIDNFKYNLFYRFHPPISDLKRQDFLAIILEMPVSKI